MMMGDEDCKQCQFVRVDKRLHRCRIAGIDHHGVQVSMQHPNIIILERGEGSDSQHEFNIEG